MFPQGGPGFALLLLRIAVAATFLMNLTNRYGIPPSLFEFAILPLICLISLSLVMGFLTPFLSLVVCAVAGANLMLGFDPIHLVRLFVAAALALLGPGAYSIDSKLFGRRVTVVPPRSEKSRI